MSGRHILPDQTRQDEALSPDQTRLDEALSPDQTGLDEASEGSLPSGASGEPITTTAGDPSGTCVTSLPSIRRTLRTYFLTSLRCQEQQFISPRSWNSGSRSTQKNFLPTQRSFSGVNYATRLWQKKGPSLWMLTGKRRSINDALPRRLNFCKPFPQLLPLIWRTESAKHSLLRIFLYINYGTFIRSCQVTEWVRL